jgi:hypothetical protein
MKSGGRATFVWGLKRSGLHLFANWLYANHGGTVRGPLDTGTLHSQLGDGYCDRAAGVAYFNNCGRLHSRQFELGSLKPGDFEVAMSRQAATIFGIEDCQLRFASRMPDGDATASVVVLRDPLNNLASRLAGRTTRPEVFRVDEAYVDLLEAYCSEYLSLSCHLPRKVAVNFDAFVTDRAYRDSLAASLGVDNVDDMDDVSEYGGGSSFSGRGEPSSVAALKTRFREQPVPRDILDTLLRRRAVREACLTVFGYDLAERVAAR